MIGRGWGDGVAAGEMAMPERMGLLVIRGHIVPGGAIHDLRKTFASLLAQRGVSTAVTQRLLEHSTPQLTNQVYTNVDPVLRQATNLLPVGEWL